jgi:hypothetical protein
MSDYLSPMPTYDFVAGYAREKLPTEIMSAKEILLEVAEKLPPETTLVDAIYELKFSSGRRGRTGLAGARGTAAD